MIKYVIWCDEPKANPIIETSKETAIATFDRETLKYNKKYEMGFNIITQPGRLVGNNILMFTPERFLIFLQID